MHSMLYGVDVKIAPDGAGVRPVCIELNGVDFGTDFFRYEEGMHYYRSITRTLGAAAEGKPVFKERGSRDRRRDPLEKIAARSSLRRTLGEEQEIWETVCAALGDPFSFRYEWLDDLRSFYEQKLEQPFGDDEDGCYRWAAREERVPLVLYDSLSFDGQHLLFRSGERTTRLHRREVGGIWAHSSSLSAAPKRFCDLFVGNARAELFMEYKPFMRWLAEDAALEDRFASGMTYGLGLRGQGELSAFLRSVSSDLVVRKRAGSYCGTGVEILERSALLSSLEAAHEERMRPADALARVAFILKSAPHLSWEEFLSVYEEFVPSVPVRSARTGAVHDACARVVVHSDGNGNASVLGAQWRVAPAPADQTLASLEERFRSNLSRGAHAQPMGEEEAVLAGHFARDTVCAFEHAMHESEPLVAEMKKYPLFRFWTEDKHLTEASQLRLLFWQAAISAAVLRWDGSRPSLEECRAAEESFAAPLADSLRKRFPPLRSR